MNAHTPFTLSLVEPSALLTKLDASDAEYIKDAEYEFHRAGDDPAMLATWAAKWGASLVSRCRETEDWDHDPSTDDALEEAEDNLKEAEGRVSDLEAAISKAIDKIDDALGDYRVTGDLRDEIDVAVAILENVQ